MKDPIEKEIAEPSIAMENKEEEIVVENLPMGGKARAAKSRELKQAKLKLESHVTTVTEVYAEGAGSFNLLRGFRWVSSRGKDLGIHPSSRSSGWTKSVKVACRAPVDLPRGAQLQMGILVGARWETIEFLYEDLQAPE